MESSLMQRSPLAERLVYEANHVKPISTRKGLDNEKMIDLHHQIVTGEIDIGPFPDHTNPVNDIRYQGPSAEELGNRIIAKRSGRTNGNLPIVRPGERLPTIQ